MESRNMKKSKICLSLCLAALMGFVFALSGCDLMENSSSPDPAVYLYESTVRLEVGETVQLSAVTNDDSSVMWMSESEAIATVSENGLVTGVSAGETKISVGSAGGAFASCKVVVTEKSVPDGVILISKTEASLKVGETVQLTALSTEEGVIVWDSSDKTVAKVSADGLVTALAKGTTTVEASIGKLTAECTVTVTDVGGSETPDPIDSDLNDPAYKKDGYNLVWHDEFNGSALDTTKWGYQTGTQDVYTTDKGTQYGADNWGNNELQYYTQDSVSVADGSLVITATRQDMDKGRSYKSGRILTRDKASWTYGYMEARIKAPAISGMWPAFWMLPQPDGTYSGNLVSQNKYGGWASSGEIDIMELMGRLPRQVLGTLHFGKAWPGNTSQGGTYTELSSEISEWHIYAVDWTNDYIKFYADGYCYKTIPNDDYWTSASSNAGAPFDVPFYIILNLAVDPGHFDTQASVPEGFTSASMYVDYVRVYNKVK